MKKAKKVKPRKAKSRRPKRKPNTVLFYKSKPDTKSSYETAPEIRVYFLVGKLGSKDWRELTVTCREQHLKPVLSGLRKGGFEILSIVKSSSVVTSEWLKNWKR